MNISIFGLAIIIYTAIKSLFFFKEKKKMFFFLFFSFLICDIFFNVGYLLSIGNINLRYSEFFLILLTLYSFFVLFSYPKQHNCAKFVNAFWLVIAAITCSWATLLIQSHTEISMLSTSTIYDWDSYMNESVEMVNLSLNSNTFFKIIKFLMSAFCLYIGFSRFKNINEKMLEKKLNTVFTILLLYLAVELLTVYILNNNAFRSIFLWLFGETNIETRISAYSNRLLGWAWEPSSLAVSLFIGSLFYLMRIEYEIGPKSKSIIKFSFYLFFLVMSRSFSSIIFIFLILFFVSLYFFKNGKTFNLIICFLILLLFASMLLLCGGDFYSTRLLEVKNILANISKNERRVSSSLARIYSIYWLLKMWTRFPIFGVGYDATYCYGAVPSLLNNIGIFGLLSVIFVNKVVVEKIINQKLPLSWYLVLILTFFYVGQAPMLMLSYPSSIVLLCLEANLLLLRKNNQSKEMYKVILTDKIIEKAKI